MHTYKTMKVKESYPLDSIVQLASNWRYQSAGQDAIKRWSEVGNRSTELFDYIDTQTIQLGVQRTYLLLQLLIEHCWEVWRGFEGYSLDN